LPIAELFNFCDCAVCVNVRVCVSVRAGLLCSVLSVTLTHHLL
jgi:hypothetical protein